MPTPPKRPKTRNLTVRVTFDDAEWLQSEAARRMVGVSYLVGLAIAQLRKTIPPLDGEVS